MEILKGTVIQAERLENFEHKGKKYYPWGVLLKDTKNDTWKGVYYCLETTQDYFTHGAEVFFTYKPYKEAAKSAISPAVDPNKGKAIPEPKKSVKTPKNIAKLSPEALLHHKLDLLKFTAPYAKDIIVAMINNGKEKEAAGMFGTIADEILTWEYRKLEEL
jgi:hypothetical protein